MARMRVIWHWELFDTTPGSVLILNCTVMKQDVIGVILGGTLGHALCTGLAVIGGRFVAQRISMRTGRVAREYF